MRVYVVLAATVLAACGGDDLGPHEIEVLVMTDELGISHAAEGRQVIVSEGDDQTTLRTDHDGRVVASVDLAASVTVRGVNEVSTQDTILGVEPGDHLCFGGCAPRAPEPTEWVHASVELPLYPDVQRVAVSYSGRPDAEYIATLFPSSGPLDVSCPAPCADPITVRAIALDADTQMLASITAPPQRIADGTAIRFLGPWRPATPFTADIANLPAARTFDVKRRSFPSYVALTAQGTDRITMSGPVADLGPLMAVEVSSGSPFESLEWLSTIDVVPTTADYHFDGTTDLPPAVTNVRRENGALVWDESPGHPYDAVQVSYGYGPPSDGTAATVFAAAGTSIPIPADARAITVTLIDRSDLDYAGLRQRERRYETAPPSDATEPLTIRRSQGQTWNFPP